jgi:hypothetical protein
VKPTRAWQPRVNWVHLILSCTPCLIHLQLLPLSAWQRLLNRPVCWDSGAELIIGSLLLAGDEPGAAGRRGHVPSCFYSPCRALLFWDQRCGWAGADGAWDDARPACLENAKLLLAEFKTLEKHASVRLHTWYGAVHQTQRGNVEFFFRCSWE